MDAFTFGFDDARNNMVDGQLRPNKVTDARILHAMRVLPRELFVPQPARALAYADGEVPVAPGRVLLSPMVVARLVQIAGVAVGARTLVLGAGYAAALLARCGAHVIAIEPDEAVRATAIPALAACAPEVRVIAAELTPGWAADAPYDAIVVDGAVRRLPLLADQLATNPPGRLCAIIATAGRCGVAVVAERSGTGLSPRPVFDCTASVIASLEPVESFSF